MWWVSCLILVVGLPACDARLANKNNFRGLSHPGEAWKNLASMLTGEGGLLEQFNEMASPEETHDEVDLCSTLKAINYMIHGKEMKPLCGEWGTCLTVEKTFLCDCQETHEGDFCEKRLCELDCLFGKCGGEDQCECEDGWEGLRCARRVLSHFVAESASPDVPRTCPENRKCDGCQPMNVVVRVDGQKVCADYDACQKEGVWVGKDGEEVRVGVDEPRLICPTGSHCENRKSLPGEGSFDGCSEESDDRCRMFSCDTGRTCVVNDVGGVECRENSVV